MTDDTGQYRIVDLRPGTYSLTFTLSGFSTVKREGIELTGSQTLTIPAEMRVGGPRGDGHGHGRVAGRRRADRPPRNGHAGRRRFRRCRPRARPGRCSTPRPASIVDNNGAALSPTMTFFNANSSTINSTSVAGEGRMTVNGFTVAAARSGGVSSYVYDTPNAEEVARRRRRRPR